MKQIDAVWGLAACDTTRKALGELRAAGQAPVFRDLREDPLQEAEVAALLSALSEKALNRQSTTWRGLPEDERALPPAVLIARHPTLVKRPVLVGPAGMTAGWTAAIRLETLG